MSEPVAPGEGPVLRSEIAQAMSLEPIRYSQVWEDHGILAEGLNIGPGDDVLSITSGGCNALALLLAGARSVTAIDMSASQTALLELKVAAIRALDHDAFVRFVGARPEPARAAIYRERVRGGLGAAARTYWDAHEGELAAGVIHCGRLGRYFARFQSEHMPGLVDPAGVDALLGARSLADQRAAFEQAGFASDAFAERFRWYYGEEMLASGGRDPAQFAHVDVDDVGDFFLRRFRWVCTELPILGNHYLEAFLTSGYRDLTQGPPHLRPDGFARLRAGLLDRLTLVTDELERFVVAAPPGAFSKANLSDIFEYMSEALTADLLGVIAGRMRGSGRIAYWNLLVRRARPASLAAALRPLSALSRALWQRDRSWFYRDFVVEEVIA